MSVYRRKGSPYWQYDFTVGGLRFRGSTEAADKEQAKGIAAKLRSDALNQKHYPTKPPMTIGQAFGRYFTEVAERQPSADDTFRQLDRMERDFGSGTLLARVQDSEIAERIARRRGDRFRKQPISNATVNRETELLRRVYRRADKTWKVDIGTMPEWAELLLPESAGRTRALTGPEIAALTKAVQESFPALLGPLRFSLATGVRLMNAIGLKWSSVDLAGRKITIRTKSKKPGGNVLEVPLDPALLVVIANHHGHHNDYVFTYEVRKKRLKRARGERRPFTKTGWRKHWKKALEKAKIHDFRWHDLRHTAATWTLRETRNLALVGRMLGHADLKSTLRYAHVLDQDLRDGMEATARRILAAPGENIVHENGNSDSVDSALDESALAAPKAGTLPG
jgi:integrase